MSTKPGDRIRLNHMDDQDALPPGATGTVTSAFPFGDGTEQVSVQWDAPNERRGLSLVCPPDSYTVIERK